MDFPLILDVATSAEYEEAKVSGGPVDSDAAKNLEFVYGYDELKQDIYLLLKTDYFRFLQSPTLGNRSSVHVADADLLMVNIQRTLSQIKGLSVTDVSRSGDSLYLSVSFMGSVSRFEFTISNFS